MNTKDNNRINMINAVTGFCDLNTAVTAPITNFALRLADVKAKKVLIDTLNQIANGSTTGVTTDTNVLRETMSKKAVKCANATLAHANATNNNTLKVLVNYTEPKLDKLAKEDVDDICQQIHDATDANFAGAAPYGIVASDVTDLQIAINLFRIASDNPRQARISITQAIAQGKLLVRELIDELLIGQMDKMVNTLKETEPVFWKGYDQAREIINLGSTSTKVSGTVLDEEDVPLIGVTFTIFETGTLDMVKQVVSVVKGKFSAAQLPAGDFDFRWEKEGFKTVTENNVHISAGKELRRKVVMEKSAGVITVVKEGTVPMGSIVPVDLTGVNPTPLSMVIVEVTGNVLGFSAIEEGSGGMGPVTWTANLGTHGPMGILVFGGLVGVDETHDNVVVQNLGPGIGHYKITITNVNPEPSSEP